MNVINVNDVIRQKGGTVEFVVNSETLHPNGVTVFMLTSAAPWSSDPSDRCSPMVTFIDAETLNYNFIKVGIHAPVGTYLRYTDGLLYKVAAIFKSSVKIERPGESWYVSHADLVKFFKVVPSVRMVAATLT